MPGDAIPPSGAHLVQEAADFQWEGNKLEPGIGIALSGGGFRAMLFHAGALMRLNELGLLASAKRISSVSGGAITAGHLALSWKALGNAGRGGAFDRFKQVVVEPILAFSRRKIDVVDALTGLLPWTSAAEQVAESYEEYLFGKKTLQDLEPTPRFVFCATNLQTGVLWRFSKEYAGDYVVGRLDKPKIRISQAVAASSAFPPVLSPLVLTLPQGSFTNWTAGSTETQGDIENFRTRVVLSDGGVYDNHGVEPIIKRYLTNFVSDGGAPFGRTATMETDWISQLRRIVEVTDNQVRALRRRDLIARFIEGNKASNEAQLTGGYSRMGAYWGIDTDPRKVDPANSLPCDPAIIQKLARIGTRLSDLGESISKQIINWGYVVSDRSVRANYKAPVGAYPPKLPYSDAPIS
jgi:NTE family protein